MKLLKILIVIVSLLAVCSLISARADNPPTSGPTETLKVAAEHLQVFVKENKNKTDEESFKAGLRTTLQELFDLRGISIKVLGMNWSKFTVEEQDKFVNLFSSLLLSVYVERFKKADLVKIEFLKEEVKDSNAKVDTIVNDQGEKYRFSYKLHLTDSGWKIYDVIIEGIGLVANYRQEFAEIVSREKPEGLLKRLNEKLSRQGKGKTKAFTAIGGALLSHQPRYSW